MPPDYFFFFILIFFFYYFFYKIQELCRKKKTAHTQSFRRSVGHWAKSSKNLSGLVKVYLFNRPNVQSETNNFIDSKWQKSIKISLRWSDFFCWTNCPATTKMPLVSLQNYRIHYFYWRRNPSTAHFQLSQINDRLKNEYRMDWIQPKPYITHNLKDTLTTKWKITH